MELNKKAAYLKGLMEGMKLDDSKGEVRILSDIIDLLQNLSDEVENLKSDCCENKELIYEIDEDLGEVERAVCGCDHFNKETKNDKIKFSSDCCGGSCGHVDDDLDGDYRENDEYCGDEFDLYEEDEEVGEKYEVLCPHCQKVIALDSDKFDDKELICPECRENLELDFDESEESNV